MRNSHLLICIAAAISPIVSFGERAEFLTKQVVGVGDEVVGESQNVLYSPSYSVSADKAHFNKNTSILNLDGNVKFSRDNSIGVAEKVRVDTATSQLNATSVFMYDSASEIWLNAQELCSQNNITVAKNALISTCETKSPDWSIGFSSAEHNTQKQFLHLFNPVFYVKKVPIFYFPYFGFPTNNNRQTGFLYPEVSYNKREGLRLTTPFYIAMQDWWDVQLDPQLRNRRGYGGALTFRWADSPTSQGSIRFGVFKEKLHYQLSHELANQYHKGVELHYSRDKIFSYWLNAQEGLYIKGMWLNDVEYLNTKGYKNDYDSIIASRLNYFLGGKENYLGIYARYYIDTDKQISSVYGNKEMVQELPTAHYHKFAKSLLVDALSYSADAKAHNYERGVGVSARHYEFDLPAQLDFSFGDWANLRLGERFYAARVDYENKFDLVGRNELVPNNRENYLRQYTEVTLQSNLAKKFDSFFHTIDLKASYIAPGFKRGEISEKLLKNYALSGTNYTPARFWEENYIKGLERKFTTQNAAFSMLNQFYTPSGKKVLRHYFEQGYNLDDKRLDNTKSKLQIFLGPVTLKNSVEYSFYNKQIEAMQNGISFSNPYLNFAVTQTYKSEDGDYTPEHYLTSNLGVKFGKRYELSGGLDYDLYRSYKKSWRLGGVAKFGCWQVGLTYKEDVQPRSTKTGIRPNREEEFYLFFRIFPVGQVGYRYDVEHKYNEN